VRVSTILPQVHEFIGSARPHGWPNPPPRRSLLGGSSAPAAGRALRCRADAVAGRFLQPPDRSLESSMASLQWPRSPSGGGAKRPPPPGQGGQSEVRVCFPTALREHVLGLVRYPLELP